MLARQIKKQLERQGYSVYLTRDQDREISLPQRTALANELKAEVFISLHMNSTRGSGHFNPQAHPEGIETFILNHASDASSRRLAHLENTVISGQLKDTSNETAHQLDVARILKDLRLDANLAQSKKLACAVQNHLIAATSHLATTKKKIYRNRGVKQALFHVLIGADMPSILVEAGFLNHPRDRSIVLSKRGQKLISRAITSALRDYRIQKNSSKSLSSLFKCKIN
jgi:N-acetylmuramoyl-L-alanine amidase